MKAPKYVAPLISAQAFSCARCGALADQRWYTVHAEPTEKGAPPPLWTKADLASFRESINSETNSETRKSMEKFLPEFERQATGTPFVRWSKEGKFTQNTLVNIFVSQCYSCKEITIWRHDSVLYPPHRYEVEPNSDLNLEIRTDFDEARAVFPVSPRAAAALLRLCLQKLCKQLGLPGKKIDDDIGALVAKGLPISIQQALDLVRVIGNNAVHPARINLADDTSIAAKLFDLVNLIADHQITQPKAIAKLFDENVSPDVKAAIARRDGAKS